MLLKDESNKIELAGTTTKTLVCPRCGSWTRRNGTIQSGTESVTIHHCVSCRREFVDEELKRE